MAETKNYTEEEAYGIRWRWVLQSAHWLLVVVGLILARKNWRAQTAKDLRL